MGLFDWLFGDDDPVATPAPTTTTTVSSNVPPYVEEGWRNAITEAERLSSQPYQPYENQRIAGFNEEQQQAFDMARGQVGTIPGMSLGAIGDINAAGGPIDPNDIERYLNPYMQGIGMQAERELDRRHSVNMQDIGTSAEQVGSFGGTRHAVLEAEAGRNNERNIADMYERLYQQGYDTSMSNLQGDRDAAMKASVAQLGGISQYSGALGQDVSSVLGIGSAQQGLTQSGLDLAYGDFQDQRQYPYSQLGFYGDIIQGVPNSGAQTTTASGTNYVNDTGNLGGIVDIGTSLLSNGDAISDLWNWFN